MRSSRIVAVFLLTCETYAFHMCEVKSEPSTAKGARRFRVGCGQREIVPVETNPCARAIAEFVVHPHAYFEETRRGLLVSSICLPLANEGPISFSEGADFLSGCWFSQRQSKTVQDQLKFAKKRSGIEMLLLKLAERYDATDPLPPGYWACTGRYGSNLSCRGAIFGNWFVWPTTTKTLKVGPVAGAAGQATGASTDSPTVGRVTRLPW